jgi:integrase
MGRPRKLWSLDTAPDKGWLGRDHKNKNKNGNPDRFIIAKLSETQGQDEDTLTAKDIQFLTVRYQERLAEKRGEKAKEKLIKKEDSIQFLFDKYLWDFIQPRRSKGTFTQYKGSLTYFIEANGNFPIGGYNDLMELAFENYLKKKMYRGKPLLDTTINKHQGHVNAAFGWLYKKKLIPKPIILEEIECTKQPTHSWVKEKLKALEDLVFEVNDPHHIRIFMLARYALMRNSEIWSMPLTALDQKLAGINMNRQIIQIRDVLPLDFRVKKRQGRNVKMGRKLYEFLNKDVLNRSDKEVWYLDDGKGGNWRTSPSALSRIFKWYRDELGLQGDPLHTLRKSGITEALDNGGALEKVAAWAGHSSTQVTLENYTDWENIDMVETVNLLS